MAEQIPYSGVPEVTAEATPTGYQHLDISPDAFGGGIAKAVQEFGDQTTSLALQYKHQQNATDVLDASSGASQELGQAEAEFRQLHGNDAVAQLPAFQQRVAEIGQRRGAGLSAQESRTAFQAKYQAYADSTLRVLGLHTADQADKAYVGALEGGIAQSKSSLVRSSGLGGAEPHFDDLLGNVARLGQKMGWDKKQTDAYLQAQTGDVVADVVEARIAQGHLPQAQAFFDDAVARNVPGTDVPLLDGDHQARIAHQLEAETKSQAAIGKAEASQDAHDLAQSDVQSRLVTGVPLGPEAQARIKAGMTPRQWEAYQSSAERADTVFKATGDMRTLPEAQIYERVASLKPSGGTEEFSQDQAAYVEAQRIAQDTINARNRDPGAAMRQAFPTTVGTAWQKFEADASPANFQAALKTAAAAQVSVGLTGTANLMPHQLAINIATSIKTTAPAQAERTLQTWAERSGQYWNTNFRQMSKYLPPAYKAAAIMSDSGAGALLIETSRQDLGKLRKTLNLPESGASSLNYAIEQDPRMQDLRRSLSQMRGGGPTADSMAQATEMLALGLMQTQGIDASTAVDNALTKVVSDKYSFGRSNGHPFHIQNGRPIATIEQGGAEALKALDTSTLDLPAPTDPAMTLSAQRRQWDDIVKNSGYWVTNEDATGMTLFVDRAAGGTPVRRNGKPITMTWEQLQGTGLANPPPSPMPALPITGPFGALDVSKFTGQGGPIFETQQSAGADPFNEEAARREVIRKNQVNAVPAEGESFVPGISTPVSQLNAKDRATLLASAKVRGTQPTDPELARLRSTDYKPGEIGALSAELQAAAHPNEQPGAVFAHATPGQSTAPIDHSGERDALMARAPKIAAELDRAFPRKPGDVGSFKGIERMRTILGATEEARSRDLAGKLRDIEGTHQEQEKTNQLISKIQDVPNGPQLDELLKQADAKWDDLTALQRVIVIRRHINKLPDAILSRLESAFNQATD